MNHTGHSPILARFVRSVAWLAIGIVALISAAALLGWALDITWLKGVHPRWTSMKIVTAVCLLMSALALACLQGSAPGRWQLVLSRILAMAVCAVGLLTTAGYLVELATGQAWASAPFLNAFLLPPGRMAVITAIIFTLFGCVLILLGTGHRRAADAGHIVLLPATMLTYLALIGYLFQIPELYNWMNLPIALNTDLAFFALCAAAFCIRPDTSLMKVLASEEAGGMMARRLLPALVILPLVIGWLRLYGERTGAFTSAIGVALVVVTYTVCFLGLLWLSARSVNQTDRQRRLAETAVRESEARLRAITTNTPDHILVQNRDLRYQMVINPQLGLTEASMLGKTDQDILAREDAEKMAAIKRKVMETGEPVSVEAPLQNLKGETEFFSGAYVPKFGLDGKVDGIIGYFRNITERKLAEAERERLAEQRQLALDAAHMGWWQYNPITRISDWDDGYKAIFGFSGYTRPNDEILAQVIHPDDLPELWKKVEAALDPVNPQPYLAEYRITRPDGIRWIEAHGIATFEGEGKDRRAVNLVGTVADITERKQAEEDRWRNEATLRGILDASKESIWLFSTDGHIIMGNATAFARMGKTPEDILGKHFTEILTPQLARSRLAMVQKVVESARPIEFEDERSGILFRHNFYPVPDANGHVISIAGFSRDITESKRSEEKLRDAAAQKEAARYARSLLEASPDPLVTISADGKITDVNEATIKATGVPRSGLIGTDFSNYFTEPEKAREGYRQVFALGFVTDYPLTIRHRDGRLMDVLYNASVYKDTAGNILGVFAAARDVTAQKQASRYARSLLESSLDPLVTISADGKITDVNEAAVAATGVSRNGLIGTDFSSYFTEPEKARAGYRQVFAQGFVTDYPLTIRHRNGRLMDVLYNANVYKDAHGNVLGVFAAARDVTVLKKAEAELKRHRDSLEILVQERTAELEESNKGLARSNENLAQFAYVASHDLQEPLRIMASYSQLLEKRYKDKLDKNADEFIEYIVGAAARMQKLIADLLAYSRAGHKGENLEDVDCNEVVRKVVESMAATIQEAGGSVTYDSLPVIRAHEASIIQLLQNLIGNALKFRRPDVATEVRIEACRVSSVERESVECRVTDAGDMQHASADTPGAAWLFAVRDNGIGIEPQYFDRIFVIFQRLHPREKYTGTGIGLSICKKIVDNLGGRIWVESEAGKGSTFNFTVPEGGK